MKTKIFSALALACTALAFVPPGRAAESKAPADPLTGEITPSSIFSII